MRFYIKGIIVLSLIVLFCRHDILSETITVSIGTVSDCSNEVAVPVEVSAFNNVGAVSLVLEYNENELTYHDYRNLNENLTGGMLVVNANNGRLIISWVNTTPVSMDDGIFLELEFEKLQYGNSLLTWDTGTTGNCEISDGSGQKLDAVFQNGSYTWWQPPVITSQPNSSRIVEGETETFSVAANGTVLNYQWQVSDDGGDTFSDLSNSAPYSNVTTANLRVTNAHLDLNGNLYRCRVSGTCEPVAFSNVVELQVVRPVIATLPALNVCSGLHAVPVTLANFTDIASFSLALTYDEDLVSFEGVENLNAALGADVIVNEEAGTVYLTWASINPVTITNEPLLELLFDTKSGNSPLHWNEALCEFSNGQALIVPGIYQNGSVNTYFVPQILTQPLDRQIADNQNTSFTLTATGSGLTYRWQVSTDNGDTFTDLNNGGGYSGVTSAALGLSSVGTSFDGNIYKCRISGTCEPEIYSREASLTVLPNIVTIVGSATVCPGEVVVPVSVRSFSSVAAFSLSLDFNSEVLEFTGVSQLHNSIPEGLFSANAEDGTVYISWVGTTSASVPDDEVLLNLEFIGSPGVSPMVWKSDSEYSNINGLTIYSSYLNGTITVPQNPLITLHPEDQSIYGSGSVQFRVQASAAGISYRWEESSDGGETWNELSNGGRYSGVTTSQLSLSDVTTLMDGSLYRCRVSGNCPPEVFSEVAALEVTTPSVSVSFGQNPGLCAGSLYLPIMVTNANHLGAVSLALSFNPDLVAYSGYEWVHPELESGVMSVNVVSDMIYISWASAEPANVGDDMLLELRFASETGISTSFSWHDEVHGQCEFSSFYGAVIPSYYGNRSVSIMGDFPDFQETDATEICEGQVFDFGRQALTIAGEYTEVFKTENGCDSTVVLTLVVHGLPEIVCPADIEICLDADVVELTGATPVGGIYGGTGVEDGFFNPSNAGIGTHQINYSFTDHNQCESSCSFNVEVFELAELVCPANMEVCLNDEPFELSGMTPSGGLFTGNGVEAGMFDPVIAGVGNHEITYSFDDGRGCSDNCSFTIEVFPLPEISMPSDVTICFEDSPLELTGALPEGGIYTGTGVVDGFFLVSEVEVGAWPVSYTYTDLNGCSDIGHLQIIVEACNTLIEQREFDVVLSPNPASDVVTISTDQPLNVFLYDVTGRKVLIEKVDAYNPNINVSGLVNGIYLVKICGLDECQTLKMIIRR